MDSGETMIAALLLALTASAPVELIYSGDRLGKVEPCGCPKNPMGHVARQVAYISDHRAGGAPALYFDLGKGCLGNVENGGWIFCPRLGWLL